jgi:hypothetical protein
MAHAATKSGYTGAPQQHAPAVKQTFEVAARPTVKTGLVGWLTTVDHKKIGMMYGGSSSFRTTASSAPSSTTRCSRCTARR